MTRRILYIIIGAIALLLILIGVGVFVLLPKATSANTPQPSSTPATNVSATTTPGSNTQSKILRQYAPEIKSQVAQGLHLTSDQLTTQLKSGKTLTDIASAQSVSTSQLGTIVSNALQTNLKPAIDNGDLTQKQLDKLTKRYQNNPNLLDKLLGGKAVKQTPTATPTTGQ